MKFRTDVVLGVFVWLGLGTVVAVYAGGGGCNKRDDSRPTPPPPANKSVTGTLEGAMEWQFENHTIAGKDGVYLVGPGGIWLLREDQAVKVREVPKFESVR